MLNMTNHTTHSTQPILLTVAITGMLLGACSWVPKGDAQFDVGIKDRGVASWYGEQFHGRQSANGEIFDMEALTAAHRTMPLGSIVRVVNLANGKHVYLRITDRGPYVSGRILDVSHAAAVRLGMEDNGITHIQVEIVGQRRPELVLFNSTSNSMGWGDIHSRYDTTPPQMIALLRLPPSDLWLTRRVRRVHAMLAATHAVQAEVASLVLG